MPKVKDHHVIDITSVDKGTEDYSDINKDFMDTKCYVIIEMARPL